MAHLFCFIRKSSDHADADISKLCGSISPHTVRCPVKRGKAISRNHNLLRPTALTKFVHLFGNLYVLDEGHAGTCRRINDESKKRH